MNENIRIESELEELREAITWLTNKMPSVISEVDDIIDNTISKAIDFTVKNIVKLEVLIIGDNVSELIVYHNDVSIFVGSKRMAVLDVDCNSIRRHNIRINVKGVGLECCHIQLVAPKIKKI